MHAQLVALAGAALPAPVTPSFLKAAAITGIFVFFVGVLVIWQGAKITSKADKQKVAASAKTSANVGIGLALVVLGLLGTALPLIASALGFFTTGA